MKKMPLRTDHGRTEDGLPRAPCLSSIYRPWVGGCSMEDTQVDCRRESGTVLAN